MLSCLWMVHIKELLLLIGKSSSYGGPWPYSTFRMCVCVCVCVCVIVSVVSQFINSTYVELIKWT